MNEHTTEALRGPAQPSSKPATEALCDYIDACIRAATFPLWGTDWQNTINDTMRVEREKLMTRLEQIASSAAPAKLFDPLPEQPA